MPAVLQRTPHVTGHVTDGRTHRPVTRAQVKLRDFGEPVALTDTAGRFDLPKTHEFTIVLFLPFDRFKTFTVEIAKPGYLLSQVPVPPSPNKTVDVQLKAKR